MDYKSQAVQDISVRIHSIKEDGTDNTGDVANLSTIILDPAGNELEGTTDYMEATFAEIGTSGIYECLFLQADADVFISVDQDNPYTVSLISATANIGSSGKDIRIVSLYIWELPTLGDIQGEIQSGVLAKKIVITGDPFEIIEGTIKTLVITLGAEWNLTGKFVYFVLKRSNSNDAAIVNRLATITDAINGVAEIDLLATETTPKGCYEYQVELRDDPANTNPETAMEGTAEITENLRS